jgi:hypothetical protein
MRIPKLGPRAVRVRPEFLTNLILIEIVAACLFVMALTLFESKMDRYDEFKTQGRAVRAVVLPRASQGSAGKFYLDYEYRVNGLTHRGKREVSGPVYLAFQPYAGLPVVYLPNAPKVSALQDEIDANALRDSARRWLFGVAGLLGLFSIVGRARARHERNILRNWHAVSGKVLDVRPFSTEKGERFNVLVEAPNPDGTGTLRLHLERATAPNIGQDLLVLRDPEGSDRIQLVDELKHVESPPRES